jgi:hypothetical protein
MLKIFSDPSFPEKLDIFRFLIGFQRLCWPSWTCPGSSLPSG